MFVLNNTKELKPGKSWKDDDGFTHPSNWASAWSADEKTARGIKEVSVQTKPDDKFYWVTGPALDGAWTSTAKNLDDVTKTVDGKEVSVAGIGTDQNNKGKDDGDIIKEMESDALKRAASKVGVGLHLWAQKQYFLSAQLATEHSVALEEVR